MELAVPLCLLLLAVAAQPQSSGYRGHFFSRWMRPNRNVNHLGIIRRTRVNNVPGFRTSYLRHGGYRPYYSGQERYQVRLVGGANSRQGNVEVLVNDWRRFLRGWRSVCDIGWTQAHAVAVCKQLGFPGAATPTSNGRFGYRGTGVGTSVSHCQVGQHGLRACFHQGLGNTGECSVNNLAGVICGADTSTPFNGPISVRLRGGSLQGDVQVKYERTGWGPVCGDGFGLKEATVVCRQLGFDAAVRSYLSGRDAGGPFILGEVECKSTEKNLGSCRSRRGRSVRCPGNRYSGAAVQCSNRDRSPLPDLVIDAAELQSSAVVEGQPMGSLTCAMDENCLSSSAYKIREREPATYKTRIRKLFRFTNKVQNRGKADYRPRRDPSAWQWHSCHKHYHSEESFSEYDLVRPGTNTKVAQGHKASFCLEDSECTRGITPKYRCRPSMRGNRFPQGIRAGCADIYGSYIDCQWIDVTDVPSGTYDLRVRVNADRVVPESDFSNNQVLCRVELDVRREKISVTNCRNTPL
ncbi:lysyl oxidase homolog 4-like [Pollicipes pollicipes]|uniref:lysyl oxidase homolog 4-like n=1 Tax=Pollicipes pollicipes TaxID=41117 RepID=UPI0018857F96|nr:lysyl oxidase homolog 4-like [Pollicipes pollicipes]